MVNVGIINGFGINADEELREAFRLSGASAEYLHISELIHRPALLDSYHILGFPGGFSFGDHLGAGLVFANMCKKHLSTAFNTFIGAGKLIIGICNGFQVLVKMGLLPDLGSSMEQEVSLIHNDSGVFEDSWVELSFPESTCVWTRGLANMSLPIRHGEGRFITGSAAITDQLIKNKLIALTYTKRSPNGSILDIAGITDPTGRILGLMPHPEAFLTPYNHPHWQRETDENNDGLLMFKRGVQYAESNVR